MVELERKIRLLLSALFLYVGSIAFSQQANNSINKESKPSLVHYDTAHYRLVCNDTSAEILSFSVNMILTGVKSPGLLSSTSFLCETQGPILCPDTIKRLKKLNEELIASKQTGMLKILFSGIEIRQRNGTIVRAPAFKTALFLPR